MKSYEFGVLTWVDVPTWNGNPERDYTFTNYNEQTETTFQLDLYPLLAKLSANGWRIVNIEKYPSGEDRRYQFQRELEWIVASNGLPIKKQYEPTARNGTSDSST